MAWKYKALFIHVLCNHVINLIKTNLLMKSLHVTLIKVAGIVAVFSFQAKRSNTREQASMWEKEPAWDEQNVGKSGKGDESKSNLPSRECSLTGQSPLLLWQENSLLPARCTPQVKTASLREFGEMSRIDGRHFLRLPHTLLLFQIFALARSFVPFACFWTRQVTPVGSVITPPISSISFFGTVLHERPAT